MYKDLREGKVKSPMCTMTYVNVEIMLHVFLIFAAGGV